MRIFLGSPSVRPAVTGNAVTAERWARGLEARGHACSVVGIDAGWTERDFLAAVDAVRPDVIHLHHALRCGRFVEVARTRAAVVVSFAGTDLSGEAREDVVRAA